MCTATAPAGVTLHSRRHCVYTTEFLTSTNIYHDYCRGKGRISEHPLTEGIRKLVTMPGSGVVSFAIVCTITLGIFAVSCTAVSRTPVINKVENVLNELHHVEQVFSGDKANVVRAMARPCITKVFQRFPPEIVDAALRKADGIADDCSPNQDRVTKRDFIKVSACYDEIGKVLEAIYKCVQETPAYQEAVKAHKWKW